MTKTSKHLVTFRHPFMLGKKNEEWPAGDYTIETEHESGIVLSAPELSLVSTIMVVRPPAGERGKTRFVEIDSSELAAALALDRRALERAENEGMTS